MLSNNQVLRVVNSIKIDTVNGSTRGSKQTEDIPFISDTSVSKNVKLKHSPTKKSHIIKYKLIHRNLEVCLATKFENNVMYE